MHMYFLSRYVCISGIYFHFSKYYEKEALVQDPVDGPILASLLGENLTHYILNGS